MNTPTLSLVVRTPIRLIASITTSDDTATQATWQISKVSNFASTVVDTTATSAWAIAEYAIPAGEETTTYYVRAKVSDGTNESSWSSTLTVAAASTPTTPTIGQLGATPQRIGAYVTNLTGDDASVFQFQFSKSSTFATVAADVTGSLRAEYLVPTADRATTHYVRARAGNLQDVTSGGVEVYSWSAWSSTLEVGNAGQVYDDDIVSVSTGKVTGRYINPVGNGGIPTGTPFGTTPAGLSVSDLAVALTVDNTYSFNLVAVIGYNSATDLRFALDLPKVNEIGTYYTGRWKSASYDSTAKTASAAMTSPNFYHGKSTTGTISIAEVGNSSTTYFMAYIEFVGRVTPSEDGVLSLSFGPDASTTAVTLPHLLHGHINVEDIGTSGGL